MSGLAGRFGLAGKVAVITGATSGIGLAMDEAFGDAGATVAVSSTSRRGARRSRHRCAPAG